MKSATMKTTMASLIIIASVLFAGTAGFSSSVLDASPALTEAGTETFSEDFAQMLRDEMYGPASERAESETAQAGDSALESNPVIEHLVSAKTQCSIAKGGSAVAMGYGCR